jgi:hypothetical protein
MMLPLVLLVARQQPRILIAIPAARTRTLALAVSGSHVVAPTLAVSISALRQLRSKRPAPHWLGWRACLSFEDNACAGGNHYSSSAVEHRRHAASRMGHAIVEELAQERRR